MRLKRFMISEEDAIEKGMNTPEPEAKEIYTEDQITHYLSPIISALDALRERGIDSESDEATYADLQDKKRKWESVEPEKPAGKTTASGEEEPAEEEPAEEEPAEEEPAEEEPAEEDGEDEAPPEDEEDEEDEETGEEDEA